MDSSHRIEAAIDRIAEARRAFLQQVATAQGLTPLQVALIDRLARGDRSLEHTTGALAGELQVRPATVSDALAVLGAKGLVRSAPDPADGRRRIHALTARGVRVADQLARDLAPLRDAFAGATAEEAGSLLRSLLEIIARLNGAGVVTADRSCATCAHFDPGRGPAGWCLLMGVPLAGTDLRVRCPDHRRREPTAS